jgi:hypothetical protein
MKISLENILAAVYYLPQGVTAYRRYLRVKADVKAALEKWKIIDGFNASTGVLINYLGEFAVNLVEYAAWTENKIDDQIAMLIRNVLIDHRQIVISVINWVRQGHDPTPQELAGMTGDICLSANDQDNTFGISPMDVLYVICMLYKVLMQLRKNNTVEPEITPEPVKQPVRNFLRKLFNKPLLA